MLVCFVSDDGTLNIEPAQHSCAADTLSGERVVAAGWCIKSMCKLVDPLCRSVKQLTVQEV